MSESELIAPLVGDKFVKRAEPDEGRIVTVTRVWKADDGHTAVAYGWGTSRASDAGSACPLDVFHRTYRAAGGPMGAKERISTAFQASQFTADQAEHLSQELYDAVAHELAEKIRARADEADVPGQRSFAAGADAAAAWIDPELTA